MLKRTFCWVFLFLAWVSCAFAQQSSNLVGTWTGKVQGFGVEMKLVLNADGTADYEGVAGRWRLQGGKLLLTQEGETVAYAFKFQGAQLTLSGGDLMAPLVLTRAGGGAKAGREGGAVAAVPPQPSSAQRKPDGGHAAASDVPPSPGPRYRNEKLGLSFLPPPGWKVGERQGLLLMGSDAEAGLIVLRLVRRTSLQQLVQDYGEGMQEQGLQLMPTVQAQDFPAARNRAVAGELAGMAQNGARIRARVVAVESPFGDAVVVLGLTTEEKYSGLKPRVESIASSFQFTQPQTPPVLEEIAGQYFYISSSSYGSSERYINMCSDGRFGSRSGTYSTGSAGTAYGEGGASAQWTAEGDGSQGVIVVTNTDGSTERYPYQRSGSDLIVNGRTFARYGDGSCTKSSPVE